MQILHAKPIEGRKCGDCTACCTAVGVKELGKDIWTRCEHDRGKGCAVYSTRPESCRQFECLWLSGMFGLAQHRPDLFGLVLDVQQSPKFEKPMFVGWEVRPGALQNPKVRYAVDQLCKRTVVYLLPHGELTRRVIQGPDSMLRQVHTVTEQMIGGSRDLVRIARTVRDG